MLKIQSNKNVIDLMDISDKRLLKLKLKSLSYISRVSFNITTYVRPLSGKYRTVPNRSISEHAISDKDHPGSVTMCSHQIHANSTILTI